MLKQSLVSVIIPCYKDAKTLADAIDSIFQQTYKNVEIIIVNDASPESDDLDVVIGRYQSITYIKNAVNLGLATSRNIGVKNAKGEFVAFLDADDVYHPQKIEYQMRCAEKNIAIACNIKGFLYEIPDPIITDELRKEHVESVNSSFKMSFFNYLTGASILVHRDLLLSIGGYDESLRSCEDYDLWLRLLRQGITVIRIKLPLYFYRFNHNGLSKKVSEISYWELQVVQKNVFCIKSSFFAQFFIPLIWVTWLFRHLVRAEFVNDSQLKKVTLLNTKKLQSSVLVYLIILSINFLRMPYLFMLTKNLINKRCFKHQSVNEVSLITRDIQSIALVSAVPETIIAFMSSHLHVLKSIYSVSVVCGGANKISPRKIVQDVAYIDIPIERNIAPFRDLFSLFKLIKFFRLNKFILVQSITPKAGLLSMLGAWICRVPIRVHVFTGQVWVTKRGPSRWFLKYCDHLIAFLATSLLADSASQRQFLISEGIAKESDIYVLGDGSICGVDTLRFRSNSEAKKQIRSSLKIPEGAIVALFIGRLKKDKGVLDLALAFGRLNLPPSILYLVFVGPDEENLRGEILQLASSREDQVRFTGPVNNPEDFFASADFLCLPSYREGFGLVTIEAAAVGIPALASRIYGVTDAIIDGVTGLLHDPGDLVGITKGLMDMSMSPELRQELGVAAKSRALELFASSRLVADQLQYYETLIKEYRGHD